MGTLLFYSLKVLSCINSYFRRVCTAFSSPEFYNKFVCLPTANDPPPYLCCNRKLWPFFKGCLGAIDGSHIASAPPATDCSNSRNWKGFVSQNVLAICSFSMMFIYSSMSYVAGMALSQMHVSMICPFQKAATIWAMLVLHYAIQFLPHTVVFDTI